jgi:hypothetical protein
MGIPQARLTTTQKGLGWAHQKVRAALLRDLIEGTPCEWCGEPMYTNQQLEADHSLARSHGGTRADRLLHKTCNRKRGDGTKAGMKRWML